MRGVGNCRIAIIYRAESWRELLKRLGLVVDQGGNVERFLNHFFCLLGTVFFLRYGISYAVRCSVLRQLLQSSYAVYGTYMCLTEIISPDIVTRQ